MASGRPKNNKPKETKKIKCAGECKRELAETNFYKSDSPMFPSGRVNICKQCIQKLIDYNDMETIYTVLRTIDIPFFYQYWKSSVETNPNNPFGTYIRMANSKLNEFKGARWKDSIFESNKNNESNNTNIKNKEEFFKSQVTSEMHERWGDNYSSKQLVDLEKFYNDMKMTHTIVTPQHIKALKMLCKMQLKLDIFLEADDMSSFAKLHDQYQKLLTSSGLRPIDKVGGDEATGMRSFSHIFEEVEKNGYIKPKKYNPPQDKLDFTIMYIENGTRRLVGQQTLTEPPLDTPKDKDIIGDYIE